MIAFINSTYTKAEAVKIAEWHKQQDSYIQRTYGKDTPEGWKGCSVGCMAEGKHKDYPKLFGIDVRIAYLSDAIFEGLPAPDYKDFTVKFLNSIQEGVHTKLVWYKFMYWMLSDAEHGVVRFNSNPTVIAVIELFRRSAEGETITQVEWEAAADAAAAYAAATAASAAYTTTHAGYTAAAVEHAANAAANRTKHYQIMTDKLCYFLSGNI